MRDGVVGGEWGELVFESWGGGLVVNVGHRWTLMNTDGRAGRPGRFCEAFCFLITKGRKHHSRVMTRPTDQQTFHFFGETV